MNDLSSEEIKGRLLGSLLFFTEAFFKLRTGKEFRISHPVSRESHHITICRAFTKIIRGEIKRLIINVPPRYGKSELAIHFVAWALARYPDCNFLYASHAYSLAAKQTQTIRNIINLSDYRSLFHVELNPASTAKHDFETNYGGSVYSAGMEGSILGRGAGIKGCDRFGGCILIDDAHESDEAQSDVRRQSVIDRYDNTFRSRRNDGINTPTIIIAQRLHEEDICGYLKAHDHEKWDTVILPALDACENALDPEMHSTEELLAMKKYDSYTFNSQMQQEPQPSGGSLYKREDFLIKEEEPKLLISFITADTAETDKTYNDATVFSLFGVYKIMEGEFETDMYALHWLDCVEIWVEPKDLRQEFMNFYYSAMRRNLRPNCAAIEKKSTGTTLASVLEDIQGIEIIKVDHNVSTGSKTSRFLKIQPFVSKKLITLPYGVKHTKMCIDHCCKITANDTHSRDDICDTLQMAIELALIDQSIIKRYIYPLLDKTNDVVSKLVTKHNKAQTLRGERTWLR